MKSIVTLLGVFAVVTGIQAFPQTFIINGTNANVNPSFAHIIYLNAANAGFFGGGAIITPTHVLTAAHMVQGFISWNVGVGSNNLNQLLRFSSTTATVHPSYIAQSRAFDFAIITLPGALTISANVRPARLPTLTSIMPSPNEEGRVYGLGWRTPNGLESTVLQNTFQRVTTHARCAQSFIVTEASQFCAMDNTHDTSLCFGDLGGALYVQYFGEDVVAGIASMVHTDCSNVHPTAYARVSVARQWIQTVAGV